VADEPADGSPAPQPTLTLPQPGVVSRPGTSPRCATGQDALRVTGSIDSIAVLDERTTNINAGLVNVGDGSFDTPVVDFAPLEPQSVELHLTWSGSLSYGSATEGLGGFVVPPASHPRMGQTFCVTSGTAGFSADTADEGSFWFSVVGATVAVDGPDGPQCGSENVVIDLQGCFQ